MKKNYIILISSLLIFTIAIIVASRLTVASNMEDMLGKDNPALLASQAYETYFSSQDQVIILLEKSSLVSIQDFEEDAVEYMVMLEEKLVSKSYVDSIYYRFDLQSMQEYAWAYLDMDYYNRIEQALDQEDMLAIQEIMQEVSLLQSTEQYEYIRSESEEHYMVIVKPYLDKEDFVSAREEFYYGLKDTIEETKRDLNVTTFNVGLTGGGFIQDIEADTVAFDGLFSTMLITIAIVVLILIFFLRTLKLPLLALYPLIFGGVFASAVAYIMYESINMFAVSFSLLLIGLGIDFAVHIIVRYQEEKHNGHSTDEAIKQSIKHTGKSIIFGAITTAFAFLSFIIASFKAFEQMGVIAAVGILLLAILMFLLMPALIKTFDQKKKNSKNIQNIKSIEYLTKIILKFKAVFLLFIVVVISILAFQIKNVTLETGMDAIYPDNIPSKQYVEIVEDEFNYSTETLYTFVTSYEMLNTAEIELENNPSILDVKTIRDFLPSNQTAKLDIIQRLDATLVSMGHEGLVGYNLSLVKIENLPEEIQNQYVGKNSTFSLEIVPAIDVYNDTDYQNMKENIFSVTNQYPVGMPSLMNEVTRLVVNDVTTISLICLVVVMLVIIAIFRSFKAFVVTMIPLLLTLYSTITLLPVLTIQMNIFSIAAFPLIIGIGIDSNIHLYHRLSDNSSYSIAKKTSLISKAILLTTLTTIIGFGSLSLINHPGMANLGLTVAVGIGMNFIFTTFVSPVLYATLHEKKIKI